MKKFKGRIIENFFINEKEFLKVIDEKEGNEYKIPKNQILFPVKNREEYDFISEFIPIYQKEFVSIMHPDFLLNSESSYKITSVLDEGDNLYFILKSNFKIPIKVKKLPHQKRDITEVKCRVDGYKMGKPLLKNIDFRNNNFEISHRYKFNILRFSNFFDKKKGSLVDALVVESNLIDDNLMVRSYDWHKEGVWDFKDIECEVIGFNKNSIPQLKIVDTRHPHYSIGSRNKFKVEDIKKHINLNTKQYFFKLVVSDNFNFKYEVSALPNQERRVQIGDEVECEVKGIDTKIRLSQVSTEDLFFYKFEEIIEQGKFKENYFLKFFNVDIFYNEYVKQLKIQYEASQAFWVFTYCNHILPFEFKDAIAKKLYSKADEVNNLLILFENWILDNGILGALHSEEERNIIKRKVTFVLDNCNAKRKVLSYILKSHFDEFLALGCDSVSYQELYYFLLFSDINFIDGRKFLSIINEKSENNSAEYFFEKIGDVIETKKQLFLSKENDNYFFLLLSKEKERKHIENLKLWIHCQYLLYKKANSKNKNLLALAKLIRYSISSSHETPIKVNILSNAYNLLADNVNDVKIYFDNNYNLILGSLKENPNIEETKIDNWAEIESAERAKRHLTFKVVEPYYKGYKVEFRGIHGFISSNNITCPNLRQYNQNGIDWEINAKVSVSGKIFGLFTVKQLKVDDPDFLSKNLNHDNLPQIGDIISGKVKNIVDYGIFISSKYGDGLLHLNNLDDEFEDKRGSLKYFQEGEDIFIKLIDAKDGKLEFGFKQLKGTIYENFYSKKIFGYSEDFDEENNNDVNSVRDKIEIEKGNIIEQYAAIINKLDEKIRYIKLSKYFFSNVNSAKSYLHNIYIEYFQKIEELDNVINNYSLSAYNQFRERIDKIDVDTRTLAEFPESENLIIFIKVLGLFNNTDNESNLALFDLIKEHSNKDDKKLLSALSKVTFSNNLIMSEVIDSDENERISFSLKNLKIIRSYIENGVFSLSESKEDKLSRELEEKRIYWKGRIDQDEGERLEFKSTLMTPVPNEEKKKILEKLNEKLQSTNSEDEKKAIRLKIDEINGDNAKKVIMHSAFKTIAAFANTNGGHLLLGVSNDKSIYGLEKDYDSFPKTSEKNRDGFGKFLDSKLKSYFGDGFSSQYLEKEFLKFPEGDILIIKVKPSEEEVFLLRDESDQSTPGILYVRNLSSTDKLEGIELAKFIKSRTSKRIYAKIENQIEQKT